MRVRLLSFLAAAAALSLGAPALAAAKVGPAQTSFLSAFAYSNANGGDVDAPGTNDWSCEPSAAHPNPVVLVHGTLGNRYRNWAYLGPQLKSAGYCLFALDYGAEEGRSPSTKGTGDVRRSVDELADYVDRVLEETGAEQVDFVGHSQGGMLPRAYLRFLPQRAVGKVGKIVAISPSSHGTTVSGIGPFLEAFKLVDAGAALIGPALFQQFKGSPFITALNEGGDTRPGEDYTVIATQHDEIVTPYRSQFLTEGPGATVRNITLQRNCAIDGSEHFNIVFAPRTRALVLNALDPEHPRSVPCDLRLPVL